MQFEQQNPVEVMIQEWKFQHPQVVKYYADGRGAKNERLLRELCEKTKIAEKFNDPNQQLDAECFSDWQLAFESCLAVHKLTARTTPMDEQIITVLANHMYQYQHFMKARNKAITFATIVGAIMVTPWLLHKFGFGSRKKE